MLFGVVPCAAILGPPALAQALPFAPLSGWPEESQRALGAESVLPARYGAAGQSWDMGIVQRQPKPQSMNTSPTTFCFTLSVQWDECLKLLR